MSGRLTLRTAVPLLVYLAAQNLYGQEGLKWHDLKPGMTEESVLSGLRQNYEVTQIGTEGQPPDDLRGWSVIDTDKVRIVGSIYFSRGKLIGITELLALVGGNKEAMDFVRKLYQALWRYATPDKGPTGSVLGMRSCIATLGLVDPSGVGDSVQIFIDPVGRKSRLAISFKRLETFGERIALESTVYEHLWPVDKSPSKPK